MRTEKQIEASRLNGANATNDAPARPYPHYFPTQRSTSGQGPVTAAGKLNSAANSAFSTGPRTPEGKARSARNAHKRQILANSVALPAERNEEFLELLHDYRESLRPVGFLEERVVETITVSDWHRRRYWVVGMVRVAHATVLQEQASDSFTRKFSQEYGATQTALAVGNLVDHGRSLEFFRRCDASYSREYRNARKELKELQADRFKQEQAILDDGGDSTDFECYVESEFPEYSFTEKDSEQTEPNIPFRGAGTNDDAIPDPPVQADAEADTQLAAQLVVQPDTATGAAEKVVDQTEPDSVDGSDIPFRGVSVELPFKARWDPALVALPNRDPDIPFRGAGG
jgi:hypothetical protein